MVLSRQLLFEKELKSIIQSMNAAIQPLPQSMIGSRLDQIRSGIKPAGSTQGSKYENPFGPIVF
jgi:hypothetical protein